MTNDPSRLTAADRDELAVAALQRMKPFERRVLALLYGLPGYADADGALHSIADVCAKTRSSEAKIARVAKSALDKLGAVLDLEPAAAGRHLFRLGTHWGAGRGARGAGGIQFKPIDRPTEPGAYWYRTATGNLGVMTVPEWALTKNVDEDLAAGITYYGPAIPEPPTPNLEPPPTP